MVEKEGKEGIRAGYSLLFLHVGLGLFLGGPGEGGQPFYDKEQTAEGLQLERTYLGAKCARVLVSQRRNCQMKNKVKPMVPTTAVFQVVECQHDQGPCCEHTDREAHQQSRESIWKLEKAPRCPPQRFLSPCWW